MNPEDIKFIAAVVTALIGMHALVTRPLKAELKLEIKELEVRLMDRMDAHLDKKFAELEKRIEEKIENMFKLHLAEHHKH